MRKNEQQYKIGWILYAQRCKPSSHAKWEYPCSTLYRSNSHNIVDVCGGASRECAPYYPRKSIARIIRNVIVLGKISTQQVSLGYMTILSRNRLRCRFILLLSYYLQYFDFIFLSNLILSPLWFGSLLFNRVSSFVSFVLCSADDHG